ncbi:MAG: HAMP domain-containing histidine kinase, partial [Elusimicrobia bacterium]|nr:HAMP domain-containing histidine kinase [Elusimicrobiota bacterium]
MPDAPSEPRHPSAYVFEASVAIFLVAVAVLWRENPVFDAPRVYYALGALLLVNLGAGVGLRRGRGGPWLPPAAAVGDCAAISAVVASSGGADSVLWVLYLMPVYSACLLLEGRAVGWVTAGAAACDAAYQLLWTDAPSSQACFTAVVHAGVLVSGAFALWRLVDRQRAAQVSLDGERRLVAGLAERMRRQERELEDSRRIADVGLLSGGIVHDLRTPLAVIQGYASLLSRPGRLPPDALDDLSRIRHSLEHCLAILGRFSDFSRGRDINLAPCPLGPVLEAASRRAAPLFAARGACVELAPLPAALPPAAASAPHLERAFAILLEACAPLCPSGSALRISTEAAEAEGRV